MPPARFHRPLECRSSELLQGRRRANQRVTSWCAEQVRRFAACRRLGMPDLPLNSVPVSALDSPIGGSRFTRGGDWLVDLDPRGDRQVCGGRRKRLTRRPRRADEFHPLEAFREGHKVEDFRRNVSWVAEQVCGVVSAGSLLPCVWGGDAGAWSVDVVGIDIAIVDGIDVGLRGHDHRHGYRPSAGPGRGLPWPAIAGSEFSRGYGSATRAGGSWR